MAKGTKIKMLTNNINIAVNQFDPIMDSVQC